MSSKGEHSPVVRHGPLRWTVHYDDITDVKLVRNIWSSAALSIDRVHFILTTLELAKDTGKKTNALGYESLHFQRD